VAKRGNYIIKPQSPDYSELPENEDLTMKLAACVGIIMKIFTSRTSL
jgi:hypothetical protein